MSTTQQAPPASRPSAGKAAAAATSSSSSSSARTNPSSKRKAEAEVARGDAADLLIPVYLRLRPIADGATSVIPSTNRAVMFRSSERVETYTFSKVYGPTTSQTDIFDEIMKPAVNSMFETGESASLLLAYGASSSGKTFTVTGTKEEPGLLLRTVEEILKRVGTKHVKKLFKPELWNNVSTVLGGIAKRKQSQQQPPESAAVADACEYSVSLSFAECYLDQVYDLQSQAGTDSKKPVKLFQHGSSESNSSKRASATLKMDSEGRRCIAQQHETRVRTLAEARIALANALGNRTVLGTKMNDQSSRSHLLSVVKLLRVPTGADASEITVSRVAVVDLAGAERLAQSGVEGVAQSETKKINSTLHTLAKCVEALRTNQARASSKRTVVPWRECKFTQLLQPYFECGTPAFMIHVNPAVEQARVTSEVFRFAQRAGALTQVVSQIEKQNANTTNAAEAGRLAMEVQRLQQALAESEFARVQQEGRIRKACAEESQTRLHELETRLRARNSGHRPTKSERDDGESNSDDDEKLDAASEMYESQISALEKIVAQLRKENAALTREVAELRREGVPPPAMSSSLDEEANDCWRSLVDSPPNNEILSEQRELSPNLKKSPILSASTTRDANAVVDSPLPKHDPPNHDERTFDIFSHSVSLVAAPPIAAAPAAEFLNLAAATAGICEASEARGQRPASRFPKPKSIAARARSKKVGTPPAAACAGTVTAAEGCISTGKDDGPTVPVGSSEGGGLLEVAGEPPIARSSSQADPPGPAVTQPFTPMRVALGELDERAVDQRRGAGGDSAGEVESTKSVKKRRLRKRRKTLAAADGALDVATLEPHSAPGEEDQTGNSLQSDESSADAAAIAVAGQPTLSETPDVEVDKGDDQPATPPTLAPSAAIADSIADNADDDDSERFAQRNKKRKPKRRSSSTSGPAAVAPAATSCSSPASASRETNTSTSATPLRVAATTMHDDDDVSCLVLRDVPPSATPRKKQDGKSAAAAAAVSSPAIVRLLAAQREECAQGSAASLPPPADSPAPDDGREEQQQQPVDVVPVKKRKLRSQKARAVDDERGGVRRPRYSGVVEKLTRRG
ncbi:hypothetical protein HDU87_004963 [Geranomyces variabilis]|uniref:Kinesin motor domain-containing protein n=1 Tax=Geranomyces variabilis TaxID=109894 RepID=A0AAD5TK08_9FUNG|nr:hypothetical protein HDU87_004963 [Geranomyces variabilis]